MITETTEHLDGLLDDLLRHTDVDRAFVMVGEIGADMIPRFSHAEALLALASVMAELAERSPEPELMIALALRLARRMFQGLRLFPHARDATTETPN